MLCVTGQPSQVRQVCEAVPRNCGRERSEDQSDIDRGKKCQFELFSGGQVPSWREEQVGASLTFHFSNQLILVFPQNYPFKYFDSQPVGETWGQSGGGKGRSTQEISPSLSSAKYQRNQEAWGQRKQKGYQQEYSGGGANFQWWLCGETHQVKAEAKKGKFAKVLLFDNIC